MPDAERKAYPLRVDPGLWAAVERCAAADLGASMRRSNACFARRLRAGREAQGARPPQARPPAEGDEMMADDTIGLRRSDSVMAPDSRLAGRVGR